MQALPPGGHGQPWDPRLRVGFGELLCSLTPAASVLGSQVVAPCGVSTFQSPQTRSSQPVLCPQEVTLPKPPLLTLP